MISQETLPRCAQVHTKCPLYCRTQMHLRKMACWGRACGEEGVPSMLRNGNLFHGHILAKTPTHTSPTESNEQSFGAGSYCLACLPGIQLPPNTGQVSPEKSKQVLGQALNPQRERSEPQHLLNKHLLGSVPDTSWHSSELLLLLKLRRHPNWAVFI